MEFLKNATTKAKDWLRERKASKQEQPDPPGVTVPAWLVRAAKFASWVATISLMYFLWLYTLDIARDRSADMHITHAGTWIGNIQFWFPYVAGFAIVAFGIPYVAKIAIPTFMSLNWRGNFWPKLWALVIALAVSLVVIAGTFAVQGDTLMERDREAAVAVEGVQQEAAVLAARIADKRQELDDMVTNASVYVRTAASMSPEAYDVFLEQRRDDWQYDRLRSYRATSVDAQRLRNEITALRDQQARQTTTASVAGEVVTERTSWIADTLGWLEGVRAILLSLVMDIVALMMPWIALRLEQARARQMGVEASGWAPAGLRIPDLRDEEPVQPEPMKPAREVVTDAETGEELVKVKPREYWRKRKGKVQKLDIQPEIPPDETGVEYDGGERSAVVTIGGLMEAPVNGGNLGVNPADETSQPDSPPSALTDLERNEAGSADSTDEQAAEPNAEQAAENLVQDDLPSEQDLAEALEVLEATEEVNEALPVDAPPAGSAAEESFPAEDEETPDEAGAALSDSHNESPEREPETREDRLIAPVAAE